MYSLNSYYGQTGKFERCKHLANSNIFFANYDLIRKDFFADGSRPNNEELDNWLLDECALVSESQLANNDVNSKIETKVKESLVYRPKNYGRAFIKSVARPLKFGHREKILFDIKGVGVAPGEVPNNYPSSNGLEYLASALSDLIVQTLIEIILKLCGAPFKCVPLYAIIDCGFSITNGWHGSSKAGLHVRAAHPRPDNGIDLPSIGSPYAKARLQLELLLRSYGITSAGGSSRLSVERYDEQKVMLTSAGKSFFVTNAKEVEFYKLLLGSRKIMKIDGINIQLSENINNPGHWNIFDFGHYVFADKFLHPLCNLVCDRYHRIGQIIYPEDKIFSVPHKDFKVTNAIVSRTNLDNYLFEIVDQINYDKCSFSKLMNNIIDSFKENLSC